MRATIPISNAFAYGNDEAVPPGKALLDVLDAAYHTAHNYPGGVPALAARMGMSQNTLTHKVSVNKITHHLTLKESVTMQELTADVSILRAMAATLGYDLVRSIPASTDDPLALYWQLGVALADMQHAMTDACARGISRNSVQRCDVMASEASSAINNFLGALRSRLPVPPGEAFK